MKLSIICLFLILSIKLSKTERALIRTRNGEQFLTVQKNPKIEGSNFIYMSEVNTQ